MSLELGTTGTILLAWLAGATFALYGLLALWVTEGGRRRARVAWLLAMLAVPLLIYADDLLLTLAADAVTIMAVVLLSRWLARRFDHGRVSAAAGTASPAPPVTRGRFKFSLGDALWAMTLIAALCGLGVQITSKTWGNWSILLPLGIACSGPTLLAAYAMAGRGRWWLKIIVLGLLGPAAAAAVTWLGNPRGFFLAFWVGREQRIAIVCSAIMLVFSSTIMWLIARHGVRVDLQPLKRTSTNPTLQAKHLVQLVALFVVILILAIPVSFTLFRLLTHARMPSEDTPAENAWDDLMALAKKVRFDLNEDPETQAYPPDELQAFVEQYRPTIDAARQMLDRPCRSVVAYDSSRSELDTTAALRTLSRAIKAVAILENEQGNTAAALQYYWDQSRLGRMAAVGTTVIPITAFSAVEWQGLRGIKTLRAKLDAEQSEHLIRELLAVEAERDPWEKVVLRNNALLDRAWSRDWLMRLNSLIASLNGEHAEWLHLAERSVLGNYAMIRMFICSLAIRLHELDHGQPPAQLAELVPRYLEELPLDPFSGKPFVYRRKDDGFLIYSVGPDGVDDGGEQLKLMTGPGDLLLDRSE